MKKNPNELLAEFLKTNKLELYLDVEDQKAVKLLTAVTDGQVLIKNPEKPTIRVRYVK